MKIAIVKTSSLGDIIHCFPVLAYLRKRFPEGQIDWIVEEKFAELLEAHPLLDNVYTINSKKRRFRNAEEKYDLLFDLQGNCKSGLVTFFIKAKEKVGFAFGSVAEWPNILVTNRRYNIPNGQNIREDYLSLVQQHFGDTDPFIDPGVELAGEDFLSEGKTVVCPGSAWPNKQLSFEQLHTFLKQLGGDFLLIWGSEEERQLCEQLHAAFPNSEIVSRLPLPTLQRLMARAKLVVAMDSLPLHLCGTTGTPSYSFFGPSSANKYRPLGEQHQSVQGPCPYGKRFEKRCPILRTCATGACMKSQELDL